MILFVPLLLIGVFAYMWWMRRTTTLTRLCRWRREGLSAGGVHFRCAACGAEVDLPAGHEPKDCLQGTVRG